MGRGVASDCRGGAGARGASGRPTATSFGLLAANFLGGVEFMGLKLVVVAVGVGVAVLLPNRGGVSSCGDLTLGSEC